MIKFPIGMEFSKLDQHILMKADTGADINVISENTFKELFPNGSFQHELCILENYGNSSIRTLGKFTGFLRWKGKVWKQTFFVTNANDSPNLLSRQACFTMGILKPCFEVRKNSMNLKKETELCNTSSSSDQPASPKLPSIDPETMKAKPLMKEKVVETYKDCFEGLGKFPGEPYKFKFKPNVTPARHGIRKVPIHLKEDFHKEVNDLVMEGVLEPVTESTEWVNSFVIMEKETSIDSSNAHGPNHRIWKKLRICLDPRDLNEALEREPYYSRSVDELIGKFHNAIIFTIVDMKKGYWMVVLHPDSRKFTCMALDIGRFQWTRLPMGTVVASDIFQRKLDSIFAGEKGITGIADDMVIYGNSIEKHH